MDFVLRINRGEDFIILVPFSPDCSIYGELYHPPVALVGISSAVSLPRYLISLTSSFSKK